MSISDACSIIAPPGKIDQHERAPGLILLRAYYDISHDSGSGLFCREQLLDCLRLRAGATCISLAQYDTGRAGMREFISGRVFFGGSSWPTAAARPRRARLQLPSGSLKAAG